MPQITKEQAIEFLNNIQKKDKVAIIHHDDLDGFNSGVLLYNFFKKILKPTKIKNFIFPIGSDQEKIIKHLDKFNKIIIADLGPNTIIDILEFSKNKETLYIDHHIKETPVPEKILELRTKRELSAARTIEELTNNNNEFLKISSLICDAGWFYEENVKELEKISKILKTNLDEIKKQAYEISNTLVYFSEKPKKALEILKTLNNWEDIKNLKKYSDPVEKELEFWVNDFKTNQEHIGKVIFYYFNPKFKIKSIAIDKLSFPSPNDIFIFAVPEDKNKIRLSARNQTKEMDMSQLLKAGIKDLKNASSGGHIPAAGGSIQTKDLEKFKQNLKDFLEKIYLQSQ